MDGAQGDYLSNHLFLSLICYIADVLPMLAISKEPRMAPKHVHID